MKKHTEWINNYVQIDRYSRIRLAGLSYQPDSDRPDDCGGLYIAPVVQVRGLGVPPGQLCLYATTNGDSIRLGFVTDGRLEFVHGTDSEEGMNEDMLDVLRRAVWDHPRQDESYSFEVLESIDGKVIEVLD